MKTRPVEEGLFHDAAGGGARLIGGSCTDCKKPHFPRSSDCPFCSGEDCTEILLGPDANLWLFTRVTARPPGYRGEVPFGFGVVELPVGLRVITRLTDCDTAELVEGQAMKLVIDRLHRDDDGIEVRSYAFAPAEHA